MSTAASAKLGTAKPGAPLGEVVRLLGVEHAQGAVLVEKCAGRHVQRPAMPMNRSKPSSKSPTVNGEA